VTGKQQPSRVARSLEAFALDLFSSKNIIVTQTFERPGHGGPDVFFQIAAVAKGVSCPKWFTRFRACVQG
jgi:hypothetical protein